MAARVSRHLHGASTLHWHIDYLRRVASVEEVWWREGVERRECEWAQAIGGWPGAKIIAPRFGASDCECETHLWKVPRRPVMPRAFPQNMAEAMTVFHL